MNSLHERNHGSRISTDDTCRGLRTAVLENQKLRVSVLADKGTDIFEFLCKPGDVDVSATTPRETEELSRLVHAAVGSGVWIRKAVSNRLIRAIEHG